MSAFRFLSFAAMHIWLLVFSGGLLAQGPLDEVLQEVPIPSSYWVRLALEEVERAEKRQIGLEIISSSQTATPLLLDDEQIVQLSHGVSLLRALRARAEVAQGSEYQELVKAIRQLEESKDLAQQVCSVMGPARVAIRAREFRLGALFRTLDPTRDALTATTLVRPVMASFLRLTDSQLAQLRALGRELAQDIQGIKEANQADLRKLNDEQMREYLRALDAPQREIVRRTIGTPIDWSRFTGLVETVTSSSISQGAAYSVQVVPVSVSNSIAPQQLDASLIDAAAPDEFERKTGILIEDYFFLHLLESSAATEELELTPHQERQLQTSLRSVRDNYVVTDRFAEWRIQQLIAGEIKSPEYLKNILVDSQFQWLRQTEFQFRTAAFKDSFGLMSPQFLETLSLADDQKQSLSEITSRYSRIKRERQEILESAKLEIENEFRQKALKVLDAVQLNKLNQLVSD